MCISGFNYYNTGMDKSVHKQILYHVMSWLLVFLFIVSHMISRFTNHKKKDLLLTDFHKTVFSFFFCFLEVYISKLNKLHGGFWLLRSQTLCYIRNIVRKP